MPRSYLVRWVASLVLVIGVGATEPVQAQRDPEARADYLEAQELDDEAEDIEAFLLERLKEQDMGTAAQRTRTADFFSFILTVSGVTLDDIRRLEDKGIDIIHTITARARPLMEQSILVDLAVVGTITDVKESAELRDDHQYSLRVAVTESLKGSVPADTILIRQKQRVSNQSPDPKPEVGETFLFLASNGVYRYYLHRNTDADARPPERKIRRRYSIYRRYRLKNGRLLWEDRSREETRRSLKSIRTVAGWIGS